MTPVRAEAGKNTKGVAATISDTRFLSYWQVISRHPMPYGDPGSLRRADSARNVGMRLESMKNAKRFFGGLGQGPGKKRHRPSGSGINFFRSPGRTAGVFTRNLVKAAPISIDLERIKQEGRAILVNSGNANACTGEQGLRDARIYARKISDSLSIPDSQVFLASTGVIGQRLPLHPDDEGRSLFGSIPVSSRTSGGGPGHHDHRYLSRNLSPEEVPLGKRSK